MTRLSEIQAIGRARRNQCVSCGAPLRGAWYDLDGQRYCCDSCPDCACKPQAPAVPDELVPEFLR